MKYTLIVLAAFFVVFSAAQWPCHDFGFNGPIANCASCNILGNVWLPPSPLLFSVCTNCTNGFFLNQSACIPCTNNCTNCDYNGACRPSGCAYGFTFLPTNFSCIACPSSLNCGTCTYNPSASGSASSYNNGPFTCSTCQNAGFYISSTGACVACPVGCGSSGSLATTQVYTSGICGASSGCATCANGYYATTTAGVTSCAACTATNCNSCAVTNAATCDTAGCATGYYNNAGTCTACGTNCATCTSASSCTTCVAGYFPTAGVCGTTVCTANCATCFSASVCSACATGYYVNSATGTCGACAVANCTQCTNYFSATSVGGVCSSCNKNTTLQNGVCYACPANCTSCALASSSSTTTVCLQCQLGFGLNDTNGACVQCPPMCDFCDGSGVCTQCRQATWNPSSSLTPNVQAGVSGINTNNFQVTTPLTVSQGFFLPPNQCQQCPYNCSSCANSTYCYNNCTKNYLYNATTAQCLPNGVERIVLAGFTLLSVVFYFV